MDKLAPCPFCGASCDYEINDGAEDPGASVTISARHMKWCPFAASIQTGADNGMTFDLDGDVTLEEFLSRWNQRVPSAPSELRGPAAQGEAYHRGYTQGMCDALQNMPKMIEALRNPPPILVDASGIDPKMLESLMARSAPEPKATGPIPSPSLCPVGDGAYLPRYEGSFRDNPCHYCGREFADHKPRPVEGDKGPGGAAPGPSPEGA